ncbi:ABC transporter ATP-binding protein [Novosphingobium sp.]|uniref:ABC transporter ATP-binding protein n=1 Tax=Novosphingobium sp. TaxID=1874826 RepID=UPI00286E2676|nr:ABC transporter ATP-binding protein [Novosphingobium sp.]
MATGSKALPQLRAFAAAFRALGPGRLALVLGLVIAGSLLESVGILMLMPLLGIVFGSAPASGGAVWQAVVSFVPQGLGSTGLLAGILGFFAILLGIRAVVAWQRDLQSLRLSLDLVDRQREDLVRAIAGADWRQVQELRHSRLEFAMNAEVTRLSIGTDRLLQATVAILQLAFLLALALWLSPALTAIAAAAVVAGIPLLLPIVRASHRHGEELSSYGAERQAVFSDFLAGMKLAKAYRAEARYTGDFLTVCRNIRERALAFSSLQVISHNAFQFAAGLAAAGIVFAGIQWLHTAPVLLFTMLALMTRIIGPVQQLAQSVQDVLIMLPAFGNLSRIALALEPARDPAGVSATAGTSEQPNLPPAGPLGVRLDSVSYSLPHGGHRLLENVTLSIEAGEIAVLLGPSGSGKTTLADMMMGLVSPPSGQVRVGGVAPAGGQVALGTRRLAGYVPQESFLFDLSLRENLIWAAPEANEDDLWRALALAEAEEFVRRLPQGLDTATGNRGSRLSGGERQRICLARALLGRPGLLILDEATSALDPEVELRLLDTISNLRGKTTVLLIAHRLHESFAADRTFMLREGRIE